MKPTRLSKLFRLPSPSELGMTDDEHYDAMPLRDFRQAGDNHLCWEDYEERMQKEYPVRYFFANQFSPWIKRQWRHYIEDSWYWIICHIIPKRRYHMLDLRQPKTDPDAYRYGWLDCDTRMLYAIFGILNDFVKGEMPHWYCPSEEEVQQDASLLWQRCNYMEAKAIHYWWNVERKRQQKMIDELQSQWYAARKAHSTVEHELWGRLKEAEKANEEKTEQMIARLLKVRKALWT